MIGMIHKPTPPDWKEIGYCRALAALIGSPTTIGRYPTQDIYSAQDERDFIEGYNQAVKDYRKSGINPFMAYAKEKQIERDTE